MKLIEAKQKVQSYLNGIFSKEDEVFVHEKHTIIENDFFVFFYNSKGYIDKEDSLYSMVGNAPIMVEKKSGNMYELGTAEPAKYYIELYKSGNLGDNHKI